MIATVILNLKKNQEEGVLLWQALAPKKIPIYQFNTKVYLYLNLGFDEPFVSKFKYYLSASKINFDQVSKGLRPQPIIRHKFDKYPIYLKHTLFINGDDYKKVRTF